MNIQRVVNLTRMKMTKWIWPKSVIVTENWQRRTFTLWVWPKVPIKFAITTNIVCWIWPKTENTINITTKANMNWWIYDVCWFQSNSTTCFGHLHLVMLTSQYLNIRSWVSKVEILVKKWDNTAWWISAQK